MHDEGELVRFGSRHLAGSALRTVPVCLFGVAIATGQAGQAQRPPMAEEVFKNVQILKGIPVDEFMDTMGMFAAATSLNCTSCHASDNTNTWDKFALDTPMKQTARRMMNMVSTINKENFKGVRSVTCYTCHHGDQRPKIVPSLIVQYSAPVEDPNEIESPAGNKPQAAAGKSLLRPIRFAGPPGTLCRYRGRPRPNANRLFRLP